MEQHTYEVVLGSERGEVLETMLHNYLEEVLKSKGLDVEVMSVVRMVDNMPLTVGESAGEIWEEAPDDLDAAVEPHEEIER